MTKLLICVMCIVTSVLPEECSEEVTLLALKQPLYNFSVRLCDKVYFETAGHFVYSPMSTWLQLISLAERVSLTGLKEIWKVTGLTGYTGRRCHRRTLRRILNSLGENLTFDSNRSNIKIVDKSYRVNKVFIREIEALGGTKAYSLNFDKPEDSVKASDDVIEETFDKNLEDIVLPEDSADSFIYMTDATYFKGTWRFPFNNWETKLAEFYSNSGMAIGKVNMMNQIGYFNYADISLINARVVELPCFDEKVSMLIYLPIKDKIQDVFYLMQETIMSEILNELKKCVNLVNISLPRFEIVTEMSNIRELLYDMRITKVFYPNSARMRGIYDYALDVSLTTQLVAIEVTEMDVLANSGPEAVDSRYKCNSDDDTYKEEISKKVDTTLNEDSPKADTYKDDNPNEDTLREGTSKEDSPKENILKVYTPNINIPKDNIPYYSDTPKDHISKVDPPKDGTSKEDTPKQDIPEAGTPKEVISKVKTNSHAKLTDTPTQDIPKVDTLIEEFNANRPFGFTIVDKRTETILFAGVYSETYLY